jgi:hypothetical protein
VSEDWPWEPWSRWTEVTLSTWWVIGWEHASHKRRILLANLVIKTLYVTQFGIEHQDSKHGMSHWVVHKTHKMIF